MSAAGAVYGVDSLRVLNVLDQLFQFRRSIPWQASKRGGFPQASQQIGLDIMVHVVVGRPSVERPSSVSRHVIRDGGREVRGSRWSVERGIRPRSAVEAGEAASTVVVQASVGDGMTDSEGNTR